MNSSAGILGRVFECLGIFRVDFKVFSVFFRVDVVSRLRNTFGLYSSVLFFLFCEFIIILVISCVVEYKLSM